MRHFHFARVVFADRRFDQVHPDAVLFRHLRHRVRIFRKTGPAVSRTGVKEFVADTGIQPHALRDLEHIGAGFFAEIRHFVYIVDFHRQKGVRRVFDRFGRFTVDEQHFRFVAERFVKLFDDVLRSFGVRADDDAIGIEKVVNGETFAQKFRQGNDIEIGIGIDRADQAFYIVARPDGNGRFVGDDGIAGQILRQLPRGGVNVFHVRLFRFGMRRRSDGQNDDIGVFDALFHRRRETDFAGGAVLLKKLFQPVFEQRQLSGVQSVYFFPDGINANDIVSELRKADTGRQTDVSRPDNSDFHPSESLIIKKISFIILFSRLFVQHEGACFNK